MYFIYIVYINSGLNDYCTEQLQQNTKVSSVNICVQWKKNKITKCDKKACQSSHILELEYEYAIKYKNIFV